LSVTCRVPSGRVIRPSVPRTPGAPVSEPLVGAVRGIQILVQDPVHMILPVASSAGVYKAIPLASV
jgi:hypothetical protein